MAEVQRPDQTTRRGRRIIFIQGPDEDEARADVPQKETQSDLQAQLTTEKDNGMTVTEPGEEKKSQEKIETENDEQATERAVAETEEPNEKDEQEAERGQTERIHKENAELREKLAEILKESSRRERQRTEAERHVDPNTRLHGPQERGVREWKPTNNEGQRQNPVAIQEDQDREQRAAKMLKKMVGKNSGTADGITMVKGTPRLAQLVYALSLCGNEEWETITCKRSCWQATKFKYAASTKPPKPSSMTARRTR